MANHISSSGSSAASSRAVSPVGEATRSGMFNQIEEAAPGASRFASSAEQDMKAPVGASRFNRVRAIKPQDRSVQKANAIGKLCSEFEKVESKVSSEQKNLQQQFKYFVDQGNTKSAIGIARALRTQLDSMQFDLTEIDNALNVFKHMSVEDDSAVSALSSELISGESSAAVTSLPALLPRVESPAASVNQQVVKSAKTDSAQQLESRQPIIEKLRAILGELEQACPKSKALLSRKETATTGGPKEFLDKLRTLIRLCESGADKYAIFDNGSPNVWKSDTGLTDWFNNNMACSYDQGKGKTSSTPDTYHPFKSVVDQHLPEINDLYQQVTGTVLKKKAAATPKAAAPVPPTSQKPLTPSPAVRPADLSKQKDSDALAHVPMPTPRPLAPRSVQLTSAEKESLQKCIPTEAEIAQAEKAGLHGYVKHLKECIAALRKFIADPNETLGNSFLDSMYDARGFRDDLEEYVAEGAIQPSCFRNLLSADRWMRETFK